jgi:ABC-type antimicrobial peptide transport system permease subunit
MVFGISTTDPLTYGIAVAAIPTAALIGCWYPAWRASRANPLDAIRAE